MADRPRRHYAPNNTPADRIRRHVVERREYDLVRSRTDMVWQFYRTAEWQALRRAVLRRFPACFLCGKKAKHVDHIVPIRVDWSRRLDVSNLRPLCHSCHSSETLRSRNAGRT